MDKIVTCDWCGAPMNRLAKTHWKMWIYKCTKCHHEKMDK